MKQEDYNGRPLTFKAMRKARERRNSLITILIVTVVLSCIMAYTFAADGQFVNPVTFTGTSAERAAVSAYVRGSPRELSAFDQLTKVRDKDTLKSIIATMCSVRRCEYGALLTEYHARRALTW